MKSITSKMIPFSLAMVVFPAAISATTVYLAGDSTMAPGGDGTGTGTQGWGQYLHYSFPSNVSVVNDARAGRSARSYTVEGRFNDIANVVEKGDWVIIEFGHNDGGSPLPASQDKGRADCPGQANETCVGADNAIVQTYPTYLKDASSLFLAKGASVILAGPTPDNPWKTGTFTYTENRFAYYSWLSASELGGTDAGVFYVEHGQYTANAMKNLGSTVVNANYPVDGTHTSPYLADIVSQAFVLSLTCGTSGLKDLVVNSTASLDNATLGACIAVNSTLPV